MLITVEGLDGAGKSTLCDGLGAALGAVVLREPGGEPLAEEIRALVKRGDAVPRAEALLFAAARAQLVSVELRPRLDAGETVVLDRFVDSSLAYQGWGRGLAGIEGLNRFATGGLDPDVTFLLRLDPEVGLSRISDPDHFEELSFLRRVAAGYDAMALTSRWIVLDATMPAEAVLKAALTSLRTRSGS